MLANLNTLTRNTDYPDVWTWRERCDLWLGGVGLTIATPPLLSKGGTMFETLSMWGLAYGGVEPQRLLEHFHKHPGFEGHVLIRPAHLDGCRVIAWMHKDTGFCQLSGSPVGGPATAIFWCAGYVDDGREPAEFWR